MSTSKIFDAEEQDFVRLVDKFYLTLSLTKICSTSCNILKSDMSSNVLSAKERDCISEKIESKILIPYFQKNQ